ncbi:MAG TPA: HAMP domain-containing sensor histidine kinase [Bacteroidia bacterium]|nr:HAMP domain-containing sensor histidine kinase [Bacteroidia bacterium]
MKLYYKLALINSFTRILIIAGFLVFLPGLIYQAAITHVDSRLEKKETKVMHIINKKGLSEFIIIDTGATSSSDSTYADYTMFKENFVSLEPVKEDERDTIVTSQRDIEGDVIELRILKHYFQYDRTHWLLEIGESMAYVEDLNTVLRRIAFYILLTIVTLTVLIDLGITQYLLIPLRKIEAKLLATRRPEKFDFSPLKTTTNDFSYLDRTIGDMMHKIQDAFNIEKEFIANVSHELLTPISILQTRLENMLAAGNLNEEVEMKVIESQNTLGRLKQIIRSLLLISQIENNQAPKEDSANIPELLKEVASEIEIRLSEKNIKLELSLGEDFTFKPCNRSLLFTMFFNLVNNAIKYNKPNGTIYISCAKKEHTIEVAVKDTGIGIAPENIQSIFYRFKKFNASGEESYGLGLPMVKTIANFHNAEIKVESEQGKGSTFTVIFNIA